MDPEVYERACLMMDRSLADYQSKLVNAAEALETAKRTINQRQKDWEFATLNYAAAVEMNKLLRPSAE